MSLKRAITLVCIALFFALPVAQDADIRYVGDVMLLPAGSDVAALGNTGVALARHAISGYWNPSAAALLSEFEVSAEYADLYQGLSQQACFALHVPMQGGLGASITYLPFFSGDIELQDTLPGTLQERLANEDLRADGSHHGMFQNNQNVILLSAAKIFPMSLPRQPGASFPLPLDIAAGVNFKGYWQTMNPGDKVRMGMNVNLDMGLGIRVGIDYDLTAKAISREVFFGAAIRDFLPSPVVWVHSRDEYNEPVKGSQHYGVSYTDRSGDLGGNWVVALALQKQYELTYHAGIEGEFWDIIAFRAGISNKTPTLGAGIRYRSYFIDYALRFDQVAISVLRLTLGVRF